MKTTYKLTFSVENSDEKKENLSELEKLIKKAILESYLDYQFTDFKCDKKIDLKAEKLKSEKLKAEELKSRNHEIVKLRKKGLTYQSIGDKFGITRERVRCILKNAGIVHNVSKAKIIAYQKSELLSYEEISKLTGLTIKGIESLRQKNEFPDPLGKMKGVSYSGQIHQLNYWDKKVIYKWLEERFEKIKDQLSQSINSYITKRKMATTNPIIRGMTNKLNFLSSKPFSEEHWVGHLTKISKDWR